MTEQDQRYLCRLRGYIQRKWSSRQVCHLCPFDTRAMMRGYWNQHQITETVHGHLWHDHRTWELKRTTNSIPRKRRLTSVIIGTESGIYQFCIAWGQRKWNSLQNRQWWSIFHWRRWRRGWQKELVMRPVDVWMNTRFFHCYEHVFTVWLPHFSHLFTSPIPHSY